MKQLFQSCLMASAAILLVVLFTGSCSKYSSPSALADQRDQQVLQALLLHLLPNPEFDLTGVGANGTTIVLDSRTPGGNRLFQPDLLWQPRDIGSDHVVPKDIQRDAARRNGDIPASFSDFKFEPGITLTTLPRSSGRGTDPKWFQHAYPGGRAWVHAWLPGYSTDSNRALVRAWIGPSAQGALITAFLAKTEGKWSVEWYHFERF